MKSTFGWTLVGLYVLISVGFGIYALTCDFEWCGLMALVPATPWIQIISQLQWFDVAQYLIPVAFLLNAVILYGLGAGLQRLFTGKREEA